MDGEAWHALLSGRFDAAERDDWLIALRAAAPHWTWWSDGDAGLPRQQIRAAVVANPAPGALAGLPRLGLVQSLWAGVEKLLADSSVPAGVPLARLVDPAMSAAMAETALWAVLSLQRGFFGYAAQQSVGCWAQQAQRRADELSVLVLGLGAMGSSVAERLAAQGWRVSAWHATPRRRALAGSVSAHAGPVALAALLPGSQVVVNLLPLTAATRGLLDERFFAALPRGAGIVNLARGAHLVEADLIAALDSGQLGHAVLDVFETEPLPAAHRFWRHPRVTVLPHVAALSDPRSAAKLVAANLEALRDGAPLAHLVDRERGY